MREHVCSLVAFIIQEVVLHGGLLVYAVVFSSKYGGHVATRVLGYVAFSLVILSAVFRVIFVVKKKQRKRLPRHDPEEQEEEVERARPRSAKGRQRRRPPSQGKLN